LGRGSLDRKQLRLMKWAVATIVNAYRAAKMRKEAINELLVEMGLRKDQDLGELTQLFLV